MCCVIHLEPEDFFETVNRDNLSVFPRVFVLESGIAGLVYMCCDAHNLYYLDRFQPAPHRKADFEKVSFYDVHKDIYRKINLDNHLREKNKAALMLS